LHHLHAAGNRRRAEAREVAPRGADGRAGGGAGYLPGGVLVLSTISVGFGFSFFLPRRFFFFSSPEVKSAIFAASAASAAATAPCICSWPSMTSPRQTDSYSTIASMSSGCVVRHSHTAPPSGFSATTLFFLSLHRSPSHHQVAFSVASSGVAASTSTDTTTVIRTFCFTLLPDSFLFFVFFTVS